MSVVWQEPGLTERQSLFRDLVGDAATGERVLILFGLLKNTLNDLAQESDAAQIRAGAHRALSVISFLREGLAHKPDDPFHAAFKRFYNHMHRQIIDVLRAVHHGRLGFTAEQLAELGGDAPHRTLLSDRQVEVLRLLDKGLTNQQIAAHLGIQYRTACKHVEHVLKAVGATNRRVAVNEARKLGLL